MDSEVVFRVKNVHQEITSATLKSVLKNIQKLAKYFQTVGAKSTKDSRDENLQKRAHFVHSIEDFASGHRPHSPLVSFIVTIYK